MYKVYNPKSGRFVLSGGKLGKSILRKQRVHSIKGAGPLSGPLNLAEKAYQYAVNKYINSVDPQHKRSRLLYQGEKHVPLHNFTGPGTRMDLKEVRDFPPYNGIDACSKVHDFEYVDIERSNMTKEQKAQAIMDADKKAIDCYDETHNNPKHKDDDYGYLPARSVIKGKFSLESLLSLLKGKPTVVYGGNIILENMKLCKGSCHKQLPNHPIYGGLIHNYTDEVVYKERDQKYYTDREKEIINMLRINNDRTTKVDPVGSFTFALQKYPSDIDIKETVVVTKISSFVKDLKKMVHKIISPESAKKGFYYSDFKAGKDKDGNGLHWTADEVLSGRKEVKGTLVPIEDAIMTNDSIVKIDFISLDSIRVIEASAFFFLYTNVVGPDGKLISINLPSDFIGLYAKILMGDIAKYVDKNPFKASKRLWNLGRLIGDTTILKKLAPLIESNVSVLGQINADIETIVLLISKYKNEDEGSIYYLGLKRNTFIDVLNSFEKRLSNISDMNSEDEVKIMYDILYKIEKLKVKFMKTDFNKIEGILSLLDNIHNGIGEIIYVNTISYLNHSGINLRKYAKTF